MATGRFNYIENWTETDLLSIPDEENDTYEYKSSQTDQKPDTFKKKIYKAASAFWNTGGGILIVGVDDNGQIDGGIPTHIGTQRLRDWADQIISQVNPAGDYTIKVIERESETSKIQENHVVLVIGFDESYTLPHMAPDNRYYVRAGAHSVPAGHYLVEAMRARRGLHQPTLRALLRQNEQKPSIIELVILTLNDIPALDVVVNCTPLPKYNGQLALQRFPLHIPLVDRQNPFRLDLYEYRLRGEIFENETISLELDYSDVSGRKFTYQQAINPFTGVNDYKIPESNTFDKTLNIIVDELQKLRLTVETRLDTWTSETTDTNAKHED